MYPISEVQKGRPDSLTVYVLWGITRNAFIYRLVIYKSQKHKPGAARERGSRTGKLHDNYQSQRSRTMASLAPHERQDKAAKHIRWVIARATLNSGTATYNDGIADNAVQRRPRVTF